MNEPGVPSGVMEAVRNAMEIAALGIEVMAVATIVVATVHGTSRYLFHLNRQVGDAYRQYKIELGKALLLALEFLVAADIITTVVLEPTLENVLILAALVIVRTFLSLVVGGGDRRSVAVERNKECRRGMKCRGSRE